MKITMKKTIIPMVGLMFVLGAGVVRGGEGDWEVGIYISDGSAYNRLSIGQMSEAGDGYDPAYDSLAMFDSTDPLMAYIEHTEWAGKEQIWRDIRGEGSGKEFELKVISKKIGGNITVMRQFTGLPEWKCRSLKMTITDITGGVEQDLVATPVVTYLNQGTSAREFRIRVTIEGKVVEYGALTMRGTPGRSEVTTLHWNEISGEGFAGYNVYRGETRGGDYVRLNETPLTDNAYVDRDLERGKSYYYVVRAVNTDGCEGGFSNEVEITKEVPKGLEGRE